ncbi:MAG: recombinase family protein [Brevundimonas sp.]
MNVEERAAIYAKAGSSLATCARHADRAGYRVVTIIDENYPGVGLGGERLNGLIDRLGGGEFEVIVADAGANRVVTIASSPAEDDPSDVGDATLVSDAFTVDAALRCIIYLRCATAGTPDPIAAQIAACEAYAAKQGWETVAVYEDIAVSGMTSSRPGLDALMAKLDHGHFEVVLVEDLDRLGRNVLHVHRMLTELHAQGVAVHTVNSGLVTDLEVTFRSFSRASIEMERLLTAHYGPADTERQEVKS